jgi:hypothetical protein
MNPPATLDGAPAPASLAAHIEVSHAHMRLHNNCPPCTSALYRYDDRPHAKTCPTRMVAEALFGLIGGVA